MKSLVHQFWYVLITWANGLCAIHWQFDTKYSSFYSVTYRFLTCIFNYRLNNGIRIIGPMAIFPRSVLSWNIGDISEVNQESLSLFCILEPKIDILVIGAGDYGNQNKIDPAVLVYLRSKKISIELLPTEQACSTFNFLNSENRYVAGAFIPPTTVKFTSDDVFLSRTRNKQIYEISDD